MRLVSHLSKSIREIGHTHDSFATHANLARATIQKWTAGDVREINVKTLAKVATALDTVDIRKIFSLQDDIGDFVRPFKETKTVTFLLGTHDVVESPERTRTTIDVWDVRTQRELVDHLREHVPDLRVDTVHHSNDAFGKDEQRAVLALAKRQNVVVIGSPKVNPACEYLLRRLFDRDRPRLRLAERGLAESVLGAPEEGGPCVLDAESGRRVAEAGPDGDGALDAGVVTVVQQPWHTPERVSLITISGISACGTYGAMKGLVDAPPTDRELVAGVPVERAYRVTVRSGKKGSAREVTDVREAPRPA